VLAAGVCAREAGTTGGSEDEDNHPETHCAGRRPHTLRGRLSSQHRK